MKSPRLTEDDLKQFEANLRKIKGVVPQQSQTRVRRPKPVRAGADGQDTSLGRTVPPVTSSPYKSKLELQYSKHLDLLVKAGEVKRWWYEPTSFKLSKGKRFRPDFLIQYPDGLERRLEYVEIKSRYNKNIRDGLTHLKWCAQLYPCFTWRIVYWKGGGWDANYVVV